MRKLSLLLACGLLASCASSVNAGTPSPSTQWNFGEITQACSRGDVGKIYVDKSGVAYDYDIDTRKYVKLEGVEVLANDLVRLKADTAVGFYVYASREWLSKICKYSGDRY